MSSSKRRPRGVRFERASSRLSGACRILSLASIGASWARVFADSTSLHRERRDHPLRPLFDTLDITDRNLKRQRQILWCYVNIYVLAWTVLTFAANTTVPGGDAVEAFNWAANLDWGTPRSGWLVGLAMYPALFFKSIAVRSLYWYFVHFAAVGIGMVGVWKLALRLTSSTRLAWLAVLALNLNVATSTDAQNQNDNYLLMMLWPWMFYLFIRAGFDNSRFWLPFAVTAGLATMAKYSTLVFVWSIFVLTLITPTLRRSYRQPSIYLAVALFFLMVAPNIIWIWHHNFVAIHWIVDDAQKGFAPSTILAIANTFVSVLLPFLVLRFMGINFRWPASQAARSAVFCMLLPLVLITAYLLYSPPSNPSRVAEWLRPFSILGPPLFVVCVANIPSSTVQKLCASLAGVGCIIFIGYATAKGINFRNSFYRGSGNAVIGAKAQEFWHMRYNSSLYYVGGSYFANLTTFYASDFPALLQTWSDVEQPNMFTRDLRETEVRRRGALLIENLGVPCAGVDFSHVLKSWPGMHIDALKEISFADSPSDPGQPLCLAFVAPQPDPASEPTGVAESDPQQPSPTWSID